MTTGIDSSGSKRRKTLILGGGLACALVVGFGLTAAAISFVSGTSDPSHVAVVPGTQVPTASPYATLMQNPSSSASPTPSPTPTSSATPTPSPAASPSPSRPPLPALLAAIGDSYTQAYSVSPKYRYDHSQFSWVVGTDANDGVTSLLEHFRSLGASPTVVDAATSGRKMSDALRQAQVVVAAAAKLKPGTTAYVTFELGTNDLCDDPKTSATTFTNELQTAIDTLATGLPGGSRLLIVPVPDFRHFRTITQADPAARAAYTRAQFSRRCAPFLGTDSPLSIAQASAVLASYDEALKAACDRLNAATGAVTGAANLSCTYDEGLTSDRDFGIRDLSTVDYFHPSLSGQAKMAAAAWKADAWGR